MNSKTIMQDIAKLAGVSPGTVSNALNNRKGVGKETKERIIKIAEEKGYFRNQKKNEDNAIRLIVFKKHGYVVSDTPFFSALIEGCERECRNNGYELLISHVRDDVSSKENIDTIIRQKNVDGILLLATEMNEEDLRFFENLSISIPIVIVDSYHETKSSDYVCINNVSGAYSAVKYFVEKGHKKIGYLGSSRSIKNFEYRATGFDKALNDLNIEQNQEYKFLLEPTIDGAYNDMKKIIDEKVELPTALFAFNDIIALGAMKAMNEKGIKIPEDVSIIGFDDITFSALANPALTTIKVQTVEMGKIAVNRLIDKINNQINLKLKIEVETELIERDSVKDINK